MNGEPENKSETKTAESESAEKNEAEKKSRFDYSYSAPNNEEKRLIESIRRQYVDDETDEDEDKDLKQKLAAIKNMHKKASGIPKLISIIVGIFGTLVFGIGLTCALEWNSIVAGVIVGIIGMVIMICAYPIYQLLRRYGKKKYGGEIVKLADELKSDENK